MFSHAKQTLRPLSRSVRHYFTDAIPSDSGSAAAIVVPPPPRVLLSNDRATYHIKPPKTKGKDTPLGTIYRIYWAIVMNDTIYMRNEIEYFWFRKGDCWKVHKIPEPPDKDPERLAIVSAITFVLAAAFNRLINLGLPRDAAEGFMTREEYDRLKQRPIVLEKAPQWAVNVPRLIKPLHLPTEDIGSPQSADTDGADQFMIQKNVLIWNLHVFFT